MYLEGIAHFSLNGNLLFHLNLIHDAFTAKALKRTTTEICFLFFWFRLFLALAINWRRTTTISWVKKTAANEWMWKKVRGVVSWRGNKHATTTLHYTETELKHQYISYSNSNRVLGSHLRESQSSKDCYCCCFFFRIN